MRFSSFFLVIFFLCLTLASSGELETTFWRIHGERVKSNGDITEIGIEHTACFGKCPQYCFSGTVDSKELKLVVEAIQNDDFMKLKDEYSKKVTDNPTVFTEVEMNGKTKIIRDYAHAGPEKLQRIESMIDNLMSTAKWANK